jgi:hypothetical protein
MSSTQTLACTRISTNRHRILLAAESQRGEQLLAKLYLCDDEFVNGAFQGKDKRGGVGARVLNLIDKDMEK